MMRSMNRSMRHRGPQPKQERNAASFGAFYVWIWKLSRKAFLDAWVAKMKLAYHNARIKIKEVSR